MLACLIFWKNWHRQAGIAVFIALVNDYGMSIRASQPIRKTGKSEA